MKKIFLLRDERIWLVTFDLFFLLISFSFWLDLIDDGSSKQIIIFKNLSSIFFAIIFYWLTGQYKNITKYTNSSSLYLIGIRNIFLIFLISNIFIKENITRFYIPLYFLEWLLLTVSMTFIRLFFRDITKSYNLKNSKLKKNIAIYGAGSAGVLLSRAIQEEGIFNVNCFFDDSSKLWKREINNIPILSPKEIKNISNKIDKVFLAIPNLSKVKKKEIVELMNKLNIPILQIPSIKEITSQEKEVNSLRPIELDDLLGRERVEPDPILLKKSIRNNVIFLSGAAGSIGKELTKQILKLEAKLIILFDFSESNLYELNLEIKDQNINNIEIVNILGSVCDKKIVESVFQKYSVNLVFHAAAYKHVPIVENNRITGLYNNILSTKILCEASNKFGVDKFVLISTDKAVRPTNVMGLSKRIAELIVQSSSMSSQKTCFSMVRFGNVLGSSGSVVPLFKKQISDGGPITLTHPKVIRYFMSISEAAQLVIQTTALARGGEVFLLDMGDPVFIKDLAYEMVRLSGLTIKDQDNPKGDIEIKVIGLRPGEKLYEELLIDSESMATSHPLIYRAIEKKVDDIFFKESLNKIITLLESNNLQDALLIAKKLVPEWNNSNT